MVSVERRRAAFEEYGIGGGEDGTRLGEEPLQALDIGGSGSLCMLWEEVGVYEVKKGIQVIQVYALIESLKSRGFSVH